MPTFYSSIAGRPRKKRDKASITLPVINALSSKPVGEAPPKREQHARRAGIRLESPGEDENGNKALPSGRI